MKCMRDIDAPMHHVYFLTLRKYIHVYIKSISTQNETRNNRPLLLPVFCYKIKFLKSLYHIALKYVTIHGVLRSNIVLLLHIFEIRHATLACE